MRWWIIESLETIKMLVQATSGRISVIRIWERKKKKNIRATGSIFSIIVIFSFCETCDSILHSAITFEWSNKHLENKNFIEKEEKSIFFKRTIFFSSNFRWTWPILNERTLPMAIIWVSLIGWLHHAGENMAISIKT